MAQRVYPLQNYRVIDFGWVMAGPILGHLLADMGAEVIKVESRQRLDASRRGRPLVGADVARGDQGEEPELIPLFHNINRGKLGITVDIKHPEGIALVKELVKYSDVVAENYTPHVLREAGLDYECLRQVKPDLVMLSMSSVGQYGPLRDISTYASSLSSLAGMEGLVGYYGERVLGMMTTGYADPNAAVYGALAVLAALRYRNRTGRGQYIDMSQLEATVSLMGEAVMDYAMNRRVPGPTGNRHPTLAPHGNYPCRGGDKWVSIAVGSDEEWRGLCRALGEPPWAYDERFSDGFGRLRHREELDHLISAWTVNLTHYEATEALQREGVAAAPVLNIEEQYFDKHFQERQTFVECHHPRVGMETIYGIPWRLGGTPGEVRRHAPLLGEHNRYVFGELLGIPEPELARLMEQKVIY